MKDKRRNNVQTRRMNALQNLYLQKLGLEDNKLNTQSQALPLNLVAI